MAIGATAVWRLRAGGNDANGGGYDAGLAGAGTDYSQQDTAQYAASDGACVTGTSTFTSATGGFTSAMVGNCINISSGTNFTAGMYFITAFNSATSVTLDRSPVGGVNGSVGVFKVGGAWAGLPGNINTTNVKPGNIIYVRAGGTGSVASPDYTITGFITCPNGDTTNGYLKIIGENGRPFIKANAGQGLVWYVHTSDLVWLENMYLIANGTGNGTLGLACSDGDSLRVVFKNLVADQNGSDVVGLQVSAGTIVESEVFSNVANSGAAGTNSGIIFGRYKARVIACNVHDCWGIGITTNAGAGEDIVNSIIAKNTGDGIVVTAGPTTIVNYGIIGNTIDGNKGHGINLKDAGALASAQIVGNLITNHNQASKNGINLTTGTTAVNDRMRGHIDYNSYFNNTANTNALTVGTSIVNGTQLHDNVGTDPQYAAQATEGYQIGTNLKGLGYPQAVFLQSKASQTATQSYPDPGAVQRQETAGGTTIIVPNITRNIYMTEEQSNGSAI